MKILNIYVTKSFLVTFTMAIAILTFGMTGARLIKVFEYISSGVPVQNAFIFILYVLPIALAFTIPWAALVSIMLVFGRLSADNEITAMRACGISILQIVSPIIVLTFALTCLCLYLQLQIGPHYLGESRSLLKNVVVDQPLALFEPGIPVKFDDFRIYIDAKDKDTNTIRDIQIFRMGKNGQWEQDVTAATGKINTDRERQTLDIILENATVAAFEGSGENRTLRRTFCKELTFTLDYGKEFNSSDVARRDKFLKFMEILARINIEKRRGGDTTELEVELNQRVALALAPIAFLLLGLPLAVRTSRRETSIGLFLSVLLAGAYYGAVLTSDALRGSPQFFPQYIVWIPPILYQIFGAFYIFKIARQ